MKKKNEVTEKITRAPINSLLLPKQSTLKSSISSSFNETQTSNNNGFNAFTKKRKSLDLNYESGSKLKCETVKPKTDNFKLGNMKIPDFENKIGKVKNKIFKISKVVKEYCYVEDQNGRGYMEDFCKIIDNFNGNPNLALFVLVDGHGGSDAATFCKDRFPEILREYLVENSSKINEKSFTDCVKALTYEMKGYEWSGYQGTTLNVVLIIKIYDIISGDKLIIHSANVGDSRTVLLNEFQTTRLSYDHKASDIDEKRRIEKAGGSVFSDRLMGQLALSRSIGDFEYISLGLISVPYYQSATIKLNGTNTFLIVASDGLWDVIHDNQLPTHLKKSNFDTQNLASKLVEEAKKIGSMDNISCLVIKLN